MTFEEWHKDTHKDKLMNLCCIGYALEAWNASAEAHKPKWIPVTEILPDKMGYYPVLKENRPFWEYFNGRDFINHKVTHWLELPEMPK